MSQDFPRVLSSGCVPGFSGKQLPQTRTQQKRLKPQTLPPRDLGLPWLRTARNGLFLLSGRKHCKAFRGGCAPPNPPAIAWNRDIALRGYHSRAVGASGSPFQAYINK